MCYGDKDYAARHVFRFNLSTPCHLIVVSCALYIVYILYSRIIHTFPFFTNSAQKFLLLVSPGSLTSDFTTTVSLSCTSTSLFFYNTTVAATRTAIPIDTSTPFLRTFL